MRLVFAGTPAAAVPSLRALLASEHEVVAVLTRPPARAGRGRTLVPSPVAEAAAEQGIEVLTGRPRDPEMLHVLTELAPDCCPVVAYGGLIPPPALAVPPRGWVNLHFSLLPAWRGAAPVQRALWAGDEVTGASTFRLDEGLDTGPVYGTLVEPIRPDDTSGALLGRLAESGAELLLRTIDAIARGEARPVVQPTDGVSHAPKITVEDARVDWRQPALAIERQVRACSPSPGAWSAFRGERLKVTAARLLTRADQASSPDLAPGELRAQHGAVLAGTGSQALELLGVQPAGRRAMPATDWARGSRIEPREQLT